MIYTHTLPWDKCLSHKLMPAIQKGWKDEGKDVHFFWGLAGKNTSEIRGCLERGDEWWFVDTGYLSSQITRYPEPMINDYDKTYFRIVHENLHTIKGISGDGARIHELESKDINVEFKGWKTGDTKHILVCPSSQMVTYNINGMNQDEWIHECVTELKKHTDREIKIRNKPRPNNEWWGTDIKDSLVDAHCLVTNMSLSAIDAVMNQTPVICHDKNVCSSISSRDLNSVEKPFKPGRKTVQEWLNMIANHQFTIQEIEDGLAFDILKAQYQSVG